MKKFEEYTPEEVAAYRKNLEELRTRKTSPTSYKDLALSPETKKLLRIN